MNANAPAATRATYTTRELQAAASALLAGRFTIGQDRATNQTGPPGGLEPHPGGHVTAANAGTVSAATGGLAPLVRVRAANAGAGASTITLAVADAAEAAGLRVRVLDAAAPAWSGLLAATGTELGGADGWRRGRRGRNVLIDRVENPVHAPADVPTPRPVDEVDLTLLDAGWSLRELAAPTSRTSWVATTPALIEVLVSRPHNLALSQTEAALAVVEEQRAADRVLVVVVGAPRWSEREFAAAGRRLRRAHQQDQVVFAPALRPKTLPGLGPDPLPKQLTPPAQRLLEHITTLTGARPASRTGAEGRSA